MKKGINQWLFPDTMCVEECLALAKDAGFDGVELCIAEKRGPSGDGEGRTLDREAGIGGYGNVELALDTPRSGIEKIAELARKTGIEICSIATALNFHYPLTSPKAEVRKKGMEVVRKVLEAASALNAGAIILIPGLVTEEVSYGEAYEGAQRAIRELAPLAEKLGVWMGVENVWNKFLLSPLEFRDFIDSMKSDCVGAYFDVGNILAYGYPAQWIRILGKRIRRVHVKDFKVAVGNMNGFTDLFRGDVCWPRVMAALRETGYDGYVTAESVPSYTFHPETLIYQASLALDRLLGKGGDDA